MCSYDTRRGDRVEEVAHRLAPGCSETKGHTREHPACVKADPEHRGRRGRLRAVDGPQSTDAHSPVLALE